MTDPLTGIGVKLDRAEEHLKTLQEEVRVFLEGDFYGLREHFDRKAGRDSLRIDLCQEPPLFWSVIVGDLVHNLRSALDHLAWQLVIASGEEPYNGTQFPIFTSEPTVGRPKQQWDRMTRGLAPPILTELKGIQPYRARDRAKLTGLAILASLSNHDKHQLPLARVSAIAPHEVGSIRLIHVQNVEITDAKVLTGRPLTDGDEIAHARIRVTGPHPKIGLEGDLPFEVAFGDARVPLQGLADLCRHTRNVVVLLETVAFVQPSSPRCPSGR